MLPLFIYSISVLVLLRLEIIIVLSKKTYLTCDMNILAFIGETNISVWCSWIRFASDVLVILSLF